MEWESNSNFWSDFFFALVVNHVMIQRRYLAPGFLFSSELWDIEHEFHAEKKHTMSHLECKEFNVGMYSNTKLPIMFKSLYSTKKRKKNINRLVIYFYVLHVRYIDFSLIHGSPSLFTYRFYMCVYLLLLFGIDCNWNLGNAQRTQNDKPFNSIDLQSKF